MFLTLQQIKKSFGQGESKVEVLKGIDLAVEQGEFCVLLGPSGSGKSTLLNIIGGIDRADDGEIVIHGERMADMKEKRLTIYRRKHLGYVFQMYNLIPNLTVRENIEVGAYLSDKPLDVNELLHTLGLYEHRNKLPNQLSGGQQQRVGIARALASRPKLLLMDEPFGALDEITKRAMQNELLALQKKLGMTVVFITHDIREAMKLGDRVLVMEQGKIAQCDTPENVKKNPADEFVKELIG